MAQSRGKAFEVELKKSIEDLGILIERIPDKLFWNGRRLLSQQTKADFVAYAIKENHIIPMMIEAKATAQKSLPFDALQPHQKAALLAFDSFHSDSRAYIAVNFYDGINLRKGNLMFMVPISVWVEAENKSGRKSLPIKTCSDDARIIKCPRTSGSKYNMLNWAQSI